MNQEQYRYTRLQELQREGVDVRKPTDIRLNAGGASETAVHLTCKALATYWMAQAGWVVNGEVTVENRGEIDALCWGRQGYMSYAVEVETNPQAGIEGQYLTQYVEGTPIDELIVIDAGGMPNQLDEASAWIADQLPIQ
jgi:hypothetical protein